MDILIEMKNLSEVAVGLAYSSPPLQRRRASPRGRRHRGRDGRDALPAGALDPAGRLHVEDPSRLRGMLHLATAAEAIADGAKEMVWMVEKGEEVHPVLSAAVGSRTRW